MQAKPEAATCFTNHHAAVNLKDVMQAWTGAGKT
jgi:hypothetical protein